MDNQFDLLRDFDRLASMEDNTAKGALYRHLYRIDSICRENWEAIPSNVQNAIIGTVQEALQVVRSLPSDRLLSNAMKTITMTNPTDIEGVEEYEESFWVPGLKECRKLSVWREAGGVYAFDYANGEANETGFATGQEAYNAGVAVAHQTHPDIE